MAISLAVHIILASLGMALPIMIFGAEVIGARTGDKNYTVLAKRLTIAFVVLFAVGTASGTIVAINIFLLWPNFMALVSHVAIIPVYMEVFAFFAETVFIGIYAYSWDKFKGKYSHALTCIPLIIGSALSATFITMLNAFMNTPAGFNIANYLSTGALTNVQPFAVFNTPSTWVEISHVLATSYFAGAFIIVGYFAIMLLRTKDEKLKRYFMKGLKIAFCIAIVATIAAVYTGIISIQNIYTTQPEKYAAIEGNLVPKTNAAEMIGGIPINGSFKYYIDIPNLQSILATGSANGSVPGLSSFPKSTWPPLFVHIMFDFMVGVGFAIGGFVMIIVLLAIIKRKPLENKYILMLLVAVSGLSVLLLEDGWAMAEIARQPWIIYNVMLVSSAANYSASIIPAGIAILLFYILIIPLTAVVLARIFRKRELGKELGK